MWTPLKRKMQAASPQPQQPQAPQPQQPQQPQQQGQVFNPFKPLLTKPEPVRKCWGMFLSIFFIRFYFSRMIVFAIYRSSVDYEIFEIFFQIIAIIGAIFSLYFFGRTINDREYVSGNPSVTKMWPLIAGTVLRLPFQIILLMKLSSIDVNFKNDVAAFIPNDIFWIIIHYFMYINDDQTSCCACSKPWVYPREQTYATNHLQGYPQRFNQVQTPKV